MEDDQIGRWFTVGGLDAEEHYYSSTVGEVGVLLEIKRTGGSWIKDKYLLDIGGGGDPWYITERDLIPIEETNNLYMKRLEDSP